MLYGYVASIYIEFLEPTTIYTLYANQVEQIEGWKRKLN